MGFFFGQTQFESDVEKVTSENNTEEDWTAILDVCDKITTNPRHAKECLNAIIKRMNHSDPHVVIQAITLLDACVNNCGKQFHLEIASREFENSFKKLLTKSQPQIQAKLLQILQKWAENDFKTDPQLNLIPSLYGKLKADGHHFNFNDKTKTTVAAKLATLSKDPNVVSSQEEEDDIAKAIELSLKETSKNSPKSHTIGGGGNVGGIATSSVTNSAYPSLYPSFAATGGGFGSTTALSSSNSNNVGATTNASSLSSATQAEPRKVRALYDFEAAEDNELTFFVGEIIHVLDDTDPNWWKGYNQRGDGLFPSNFVTADLTVDPERLDINQQQQKQKQKISNSNQIANDDDDNLHEKTDGFGAFAVGNQTRIEIDETKIDRLLHLLHEANPEDPTQDSDELLRLEKEVHQMGPLIDAELERVDRKHAQLTQLSSDLVDAINLYHSLMRDDRAALVLGSHPGLQQSSIGAMMVPPSQQQPSASSASSSYPITMNYGPQSGYFPTHTQFYGIGMPSMPSMPPYAPNTAAAATAGGVTTTASTTAMPNGGYPPQQQQFPMNVVGNGATDGHHNQIASSSSTIPMQFQNGGQQQQPPPPQQQQPHLNGGLNSMPPMHHQMNTATAGPGQLYNMPTGGQQQPNHQQQQPPQPHQVAYTTTQSTASPATVVGHPQQQFMSTQQPQPTHGGSFVQNPQVQYPQQQQQQQQQPTGGFMLAGQQTGMIPPNGPMPMTGIPHPPPPATTNVNVGAGHIDQFSQLHQHMAALALNANGGIMSQQQQQQHQHQQPITQNFLVQNEPKGNIPIYQQQR